MKWPCEAISSITAGSGATVPHFLPMPHFLVTVPHFVAALREECGFLAEGLAVGAVPGEVGVLAGAVDGDFSLADGAGESGAVVDAVGVGEIFGGEGGGGGD